MDFGDKRLAQQRLAWVEHARAGIVSAIGDVVDPTFKVIPTVDPLRFILKISLNHPLQKNTRAPLRTYIRVWAQQFGCDVPQINIGPQRVQAEVLTRERTWNRTGRGRFKPKQKFGR
jgi:hypothetical protein